MIPKNEEKLLLQKLYMNIRFGYNDKELLETINKLESLLNYKDKIYLQLSGYLAKETTLKFMYRDKIEEINNIIKGVI